MTDELLTQTASVPDTPKGIFLPSMTWTNDPQAAEQEKQSLLIWRERLAALMAMRKEGLNPQLGI